MTQLKDYSVGSKSLTFNAFLTKIFSTVFLGLVISAAVAYGTYLLVLNNPLFFSRISLFILLAQVGIAIFFSVRLAKMSKNTAWLCYILYSLTMGFTFGTLPLIYDGGSIFFAVVMTAVLFASMSFIGHTTKIDLSKFSSIFMIGLVMILVVSIVNMFIGSRGIDMFINYAGVILFLGIIAWDMQKMRDLYLAANQDSELGAKIVVVGAFELYLDFINLFIRILSIFGRSNDN